MKIKFVLLLILLFASGAIAQTTSSSAQPRYYGARAADPATCSVLTGGLYWNTISAVYRYCSATNTWSNLSGGGGGSGITTLNGLTADPQTFAIGTSGTNFNISSATATHTFNFPDASGTNRGLLTSANWTTFNNKVSLTGAETLTNKTLTSPVINVGSDATGDIYYRNGSGLFTRLAAGSDTHVLTLASGVPTWAAASGGGASSPLSLTANNASEVPLTITGAASQTANLITGRNSTPTTIFSVASDGDVTAPEYTATSLIYNLGGSGRIRYSSGVIIAPANLDLFRFDTAGMLKVQSGGSLGWSSAANLTATADAGLSRFAAGVLATTDGVSGIRGFDGGGAAVASASALPLPTGRVFHVTGTTSITSITSTNFQSGVCITMIFDDVLTVTDNDGTLNLAGNFVTTANDSLSLCYDGSAWIEISRSVN